MLNKYHNQHLCGTQSLVYGQAITRKILSYLGSRNGIAVEGQEKSDAVKGQALFLVKVKSRAKFFVLTDFDCGQSSESM